MPRKRLIRVSDFAYHVTNRSNNKEWFYLPLEQIWRIFETTLVRITELYGVEIHAFVLMSNHYHLIISTPYWNIDQAIRYLQTEVSKAIAKKSNRINHIFGTRYHWTILRGPESYAYVYKYVYRNPVKAGICTQVEDYAFSTLKYYRESTFGIPMAEAFIGSWEKIPCDFKKRLAWLNKPAPNELEALIGTALRRYEFAFSKHKSLRAKLSQLQEIYL